MNKLLIITAPSGAGKTTIVKHLLKTFPNTLAFSVSATTRAQRPNEVNGVDYYFINIAEFLTKRENDEFVEWQEVYENQFYGTLKKEVDRLWEAGKTVLFDIDVKGAMNIKKAYPEQSLSIFVQPPSYELLEQRLKRRNTESEE
ncbi:MAG: guanylate kinase, partial [Saprospiraceae bacterium]|nr:guanylate kinase [Saprospiraceae bacterium]